MKERSDYYPCYEKLIRMRLEEQIEESPEYKVLAKRYPHLVESIRLKREIKRLKEKLKFMEKRSARFQVKREIVSVEAKLKRESALKCLYGENKQESIFNIRFTIETSKKHISSSARGVYNVSLKARNDLQKGYTDLRKKLRRLMYRKLPPSVFDLRSLDTAEKGLAVKEWIQKRRK